MNAFDFGFSNFLHPNVHCAMDREFYSLSTSLRIIGEGVVDNRVICFLRILVILATLWRENHIETFSDGYHFLKPTPIFSLKYRSVSRPYYIVKTAF